MSTAAIYAGCRVQSRNTISTKKAEKLESEVMIRVQSLLDERECLLSRVDPYSDSGNSIADWINE